MDHPVGSRCATAKAFEIFERTTMYLRSRGNKLFGCPLGAGKAEHLMTSTDQFSDDCGTNEACSSCNKCTHVLFLLSSYEFGRGGRSVPAIGKPSRNPGCHQSPFAGGSRQTIDLDQLTQPVFG